MQKIELSRLLNSGDATTSAFAAVTLGVIEALASGSISADVATRLYFDADNCLFVHKYFHDKLADEIMSHGVQLQDLFDALPSNEAQQEFQRELTTMRSLCLQLFERQETLVSWPNLSTEIDSMIHVLATIELAPGQRRAFLDEFHKLMPKVRAEAGCIEYGPAVDVATSIPIQTPPRDDAVLVIEKWESVPALVAHLAAPHMADFRAATAQFVRGIVIQVLEPA
jgi:quinol monooxygenase YgiN